MPVDIQADRPINPDEGIPKPQIDVTARPVETYVKPVSASASALGQLAGSLKSLNPALGQIEEKFKQQAVEQGETQAESAFQKVHGDYGAAVKQGLIPTVFNPFARMAARETFGHLAADKNRSDMWSDPTFLKSIDGVTTIQAYDQAVSDYQSKWESQNLGHDSHSDPIFQHAFQGLLSGHMQDDREKFTSKVNENFIGTTRLQTIASQGAAIRGAIENHESLNDLVKTLEGNTQKLLGLGFSRKFVAESNQKALAEVAADVGRNVIGDGSVSSDDIFKLAQHISGFEGSSLWDTMGDIRTETRDKIMSERRTQAVIARSLDTEQTKQALRDVTHDLYTNAAAGTLKPMETYRDKLAAWDPGKAAKLPALYAALSGATWPNQELVESALMRGIHPVEGGHETSQDEIDQALVDKKITPQVYQTLTKQLEGENNPKGREKTPLNDNEWTIFHQTSGPGVYSAYAADPQRQQIGSLIMGDVWEGWRNWWESHPEATGAQKATELRTLQHLAAQRRGGIHWHEFDSENPSAQVGTHNWNSEHIFPSADAQELINKLDAVKHGGGKVRLDDATLAYLRSWGLTTADDINNAIQGQAVLNGVFPKPEKKAP